MIREKKITTLLPYIILGIGILLGLFRLWYFIHSAIPLGYDSGLYKEIFFQYQKVISSLDFSLLSQWIKQEPLIGILAALTNRLGISFDWMLTRGIGIINFLSGVLLFWYFKSKAKNLRWGVFAAILYRTSIAQYQVFWLGYLKQTLGISIMLLLLILGEYKKIFFQGILFFLLILLHKHTALYVGAVFLVSTIIDGIQNKQLPWKKIIIWTVAGGIALLVYVPLWSRVIIDAIKSVASGGGGIFMTPLTYITHSWHILLLSFLGLGWRIKDFYIDRTKGNKRDVWFIGYIVGVIRIVFSLINYNRTLVFLDVFVVIFAGYFLFRLYQLRSLIWKYLVFIALLGVSIYYVVYVNRLAHPLISPEEFSFIQNLSTFTEPNAIIISTHKNYSPWIMGRSQRDYINPGLSDIDVWTHPQWKQWRANNGQQKCTMLQKSYAHLSRPLYLWLGEQQRKENLSGGTCFTRMQQGSTWVLFKISLQ